MQSFSCVQRYKVAVASVDNLKIKVNRFNECKQGSETLYQRHSAVETMIKADRMIIVAYYDYLFYI